LNRRNNNENTPVFDNFNGRPARFGLANCRTEAKTCTEGHAETDPNRFGGQPVVAAAKQQVANQLYNVKVFVDKMGPIAVAIENTDKDATARKLTTEEIAANETNKQKLIAAIRGCEKA
jgi:hypothetical protein